VLRAVDTLEALGHSAGTLAAAVEQQAAEIEFGPGATALAAEVGEYGIEVVTQFAPEALQALGIHSIDRLWTAAQLATRTNGVILVTPICHPAVASTSSSKGISPASAAGVRLRPTSKSMTISGSSP